MTFPRPLRERLQIRFGNLVEYVRYAVGGMMGEILDEVTSNRSHRIIYDGDGLHPYLSRWYLFGAPTMVDGSAPYDRWGNPKPDAQWPSFPMGLYIHKFHRGDVDRELHNHPWRWALSFVVDGGYAEERRDGDRVTHRSIHPLSFNFLRSTDFHRVDLAGSHAWTLFLVGPKFQAWGFWNRHTHQYTPWRDFLAKRQRSLT